MKTIILSSIAIFLCITSCKKEEKADYVIISGKIEHPNSDSLFIISQSGISLQSIALQKDHSFSDTLVVKDGYYMLSDGKEQAQVYLKRGYTIHIKLDAEKFDESLSYEGVGAPENNYLAKKTLKEEDIRKTLESYFMAEPNEVRFLKVADSIKNVYTNLLTSDASIDESFKTIEKKHILLEHMANLATYQDILTNYGEEPQNLSKNYPNPMSKFDINNDSLSQSPLYLFMSEKVLMPMVQNQLAKDTTQSDITIPYLRIAGSVVKNEQGRNEIVYNFFNVYMKETKDFPAFFSLADSLLTNPDYKKELLKKKENLNKIAKGNPSPNFELYDINNQLVNLRSLKGKLVYIDIWATWCGPCKEEIKPLKELEEKFKTKNIAFVSMCVWDEKENWIRMVKNKKLEGIQLFAPDKNMPFLKDYMIEGIPHFILLDKDGKIISANAARPSDEALSDELNALLK